jgi:hypothetical protein
MSLQQFQIDVAAQIASTPLAANVPVFIFRPRAAQTAVQIQSKIDAALGALSAKNDKSGLAAFVMMPLLDTKEQELPGPFLHLKCQVRVQENPTVNMGANGTQIACEDFAIGVSQALHLWTPGGVAGIVRASRDTITPDLRFDPLVTYNVSVESEPSFDDLGFTLPPVIEVGGGTVALASATAGASIYYTLDGTTPFPSTGEIVTTAQLYNAPFAAPASGSVLRAAAFGAGLRGSDITWLQF